MVLQKQLIPVTLSGGIDTKKDAFIQGNTFDELENAVQSKSGQLSKRFGSTIQPLTGSAPTDVTSYPQGLFYLGNEQVAITSNGLYSYSTSLSAYKTIAGQTPFLTATSRVLQSSTLAHINPVCASFGTYSLTAYQVAGQTPINWIIDNNGATIATGSIAAGTLSKLIAWQAQGSSDNYFFIGWVVSGSSTLQVVRFSATTGIVSPSPTTITLGITDVGTGSACVLDIAGGNNLCYVIYRTTTNTTLSKSWAADLTSPTLTTVTHTPVSCTALAVAGIQSSQQYFMYATATTLQLTRYNGATLLNTSPSISSLSHVACGIAFPALTGSAYTILAVAGTATGTSVYVFLDGLLSAATAPVAMGGGLASKPFGGRWATGADTPGVLLYHPDSTATKLQGSYWLAQFSQQGGGVPKLGYSAKYLYGTGGTLPTAANLSAPGSALIFPALKAVAVVEQAGSFLFTYNIAQLRADDFGPFGYLARPMGVTINGGLYYGRGVLQHYDGATVNEAGFHVYPEINSVSGTGVGSAFTAGAKFQIAAVYSWRDNVGKLHESAPSLVSTYTATGAELTVSIAVKPLRLTTKANVNIDFYMTAANGTVFYRVGTQANESAIAGIAISTNTPPNSASNPLYTTGGIVDNVPPGNVSIVAKVGNRIWVNDTENPSQIAYSKLIDNEGGLSFSDVFTLRLPTAETVTGISNLDDKTVLTSRQGVYQTFSSGPDNLGNNAYPAIQPIACNVGCIEPRSMVSTDLGLFFQSPLGLYLLDRGLNSSFIGAPVEAYKALTIQAALLVAGQNQIRFYGSGGRVLVYDLYHKQWYTFTGQDAVGAAFTPVSQTVQYYNTLGVVHNEASNSAVEGSTPITYRIRTTWMSMAGLQGFQRIYRAIILGKYYASTTLTIAIFHDFKSVASETKTITANPTAVSTPADTLDGVWQYSICPAQQKCETFQLLITDSGGLSFALSGLALEIGALPRGVRTPANRRLT